MELEAIRQLRAAGYFDMLTKIETLKAGLYGVMDLAVVPRLLADARFAHGIFYGLHTNVGQDLYDFRSHTGTFGKGSLQIVLDKKTGRAWCDVDGWSPYSDVVGVIGHLFRDVLPGWWRGWK